MGRWVFEPWVGPHSRGPLLERKATVGHYLIKGPQRAPILPDWIGQEDTTGHKQSLRYPEGLPWRTSRVMTGMLNWSGRNLAASAARGAETSILQTPAAEASGELIAVVKSQGAQERLLPIPWRNHGIGKNEKWFSCFISISCIVQSNLN